MNPGNMSAGRPLKECPNPSWLSFLYCLLPLEPDWLSPMQNKACTCQQNGHTLKASQGRGNVFLPEVLTRVLSLLFPGHFFFFFSFVCPLSGSSSHAHLGLLFIFQLPNFGVFVCVCSVMFDSATPGTVSHQASLSMEFSKQEYWSGLPFLTPVDLPDSGIEPESLELTAWAGGFFTTLPPGK